MERGKLHIGEAVYDLTVQDVQSTTPVVPQRDYNFYLILCILVLVIADVTILIIGVVLRPYY